MAVTRLAAPKPRKSPLAIFDQPTFDKDEPDAAAGWRRVVHRAVDEPQPGAGGDPRSSGLPMNSRPSSTTSPKPSRPREIWTSRKTCWLYVGPRMIAYIGAGQSATTTDDSLESALKNGWSPTAASRLLEAAFPKLTLVAEVKKPDAFGKALDAAMIAINNELKAQAIEKAREKQAAGDQGKGAGGGRMAGPGGTTRRAVAQRDPGAVVHAHSVDRSGQDVRADDSHRFADSIRPIELSSHDPAR